MARRRVRLPTRARADLVTSNQGKRAPIVASCARVRIVPGVRCARGGRRSVVGERATTTASKARRAAAELESRGCDRGWRPERRAVLPARPRPPIAIVTGRGARRRAIGGASGKGLATAGVVLGAIGLVVGSYVWIVASTCDCL
jgi:hypothetical protein